MIFRISLLSLVAFLFTTHSLQAQEIFREAKELLEQEKSQALIELLSPLKNAYTDHPQFQLMLGRAYHQQKDYDEEILRQNETNSCQWSRTSSSQT